MSLQQHQNKKLEFLTKISVRNSFRSQPKKYYANIENKYKFKEIEYEKEEEDTFLRWPWKEEEVTVKGRKRSRKGTKDWLRDEIKKKKKR